MRQCLVLRTASSFPSPVDGSSERSRWVPTGTVAGGCWKWVIAPRYPAAKRPPGRGAATTFLKLIKVARDVTDGAAGGSFSLQHLSVPTLALHQPEVQIVNRTPHLLCCLRRRTYALPPLAPCTGPRPASWTWTKARGTWPAARPGPGPRPAPCAASAAARCHAGSSLAMGPGRKGGLRRASCSC